MTIRCILVDDEPMGLQVLLAHAARLPFLEVIQTFSSGVDALAFLKTENIDLVLLDIEMPGFSGLELARIIGGRTNIVFTTAYPNYAVDGFDLAATDYLVKPVSFNRFLQAVNRIRDKSGTSSPEFLFLKSGYDWVRIDLDALLYLEADDNYVTFYEANRKTLCRITLQEALDKLPPDQFLRIHKSFAVALSKIDKVERGQIMIAGVTLPVSATFREKLFIRIENKPG